MMDVKVMPYHTGVALLIGNQYKEGGTDLETLSGTHNDCDNVEKLLKGFGYKVYIKTDRTRDQMLNCCESLAQYVYPDSCKRLIVYFSGHGDVNSDNEDCLIAEKGSEIPVYQLISTIALPKNDSMIKMFFIDACRGRNDEVDTAVLAPPNNTPTKGAPFHKKIFENVLIACSCPPTFTSHMASSDAVCCGSQWTNSLIEALDKSTVDESLFSILAKAEILLKNYAKGKKLQTSEFTSTLTEVVYFKTEAKIYLDAKRKYGECSNQLGIL